MELIPPKKNVPETNKVEVRYQVKFPDTYGSAFLEKHTPVNDLRELTPLKSLTETFGVIIHVSPARSATSNAVANIKASIMALVSRIRKDLEDERTKKLTNNIQKQFDAKLDAIFRRVEANKAEAKQDLLQALAREI